MKRKESYHFRIFDLPKPVCDYISTQPWCIDNECQKIDDSELYVISFPLTEEMLMDEIKIIIKEHKDTIGYYGIFVELTTDQAMDDLHFPMHVLKAHRKLGGFIDISLIKI